MGLAWVAKIAEIAEIAKITKAASKGPEAAEMIEFGLLRDQEILYSTKTWSFTNTDRI